MLTTDLETGEEKSVLRREKSRIVVLMKRMEWTLTEEASKSRPAKEPIREKIEEEETRAADLEAGHEVAEEVEEETDEEEATGRVPTEPSSLSESTTCPPVAIGPS